MLSLPHPLGFSCWLCSLIPHTSHHIHRALFVRSHLSLVLLKGKSHPQGSFFCQLNPHTSFQIGPHLQGSLCPLSRPHQQDTAHNQSDLVQWRIQDFSEGGSSIQKVGTVQVLSWQHSPMQHCNCGSYHTLVE